MAIIPTNNEFSTASGVTIPTSGEFVKVPEGGGGDPNTQKNEYVQAVDGSTWRFSDFVTAYCDNGDGVYWGTVEENNINTAYGALGFMFLKCNIATGTYNKEVGFPHRVEGWYAGATTSGSFQLGVGAKVVVFFTPISVL